ncbi:hypothetical protein FJZ28_02840 [Candidatus Peregrinibacteria bacterium]|nr:hypothetical protein [Candidatus Peregrinibacteria bacterium]
METSNTADARKAPDPDYALHLQSEMARRELTPKEIDALTQFQIGQSLQRELATAAGNSSFRSLLHR